MLTGCNASAPLFDQSPLRNYVVATVNNDTDHQVIVTVCYDRRCHNTDQVDKVAAHDYVQDGINNDSAGLAWFRIQSATGTTVGCLRLRYRSGQRTASLQVSEAADCH
jgi:hypothetical protein